MHTRQGVAKPALSQHNPNQQKQFWSDEPLTPRQEFILCRELDCSPSSEAVTVSTETSDSRDCEE